MFKLRFHIFFSTQKAPMTLVLQSIIAYLKKETTAEAVQNREIDTERERERKREVSV